MLKTTGSFGGYSVNNQEKAKAFYTQTLGLKLLDDRMGLMFEMPGGGKFFLYEKQDHVPATFTVLNLEVENIDEAMETLTAAGVAFERYDNMHQDEKGVARGRAAGMGPDIAWFKDPAGNVLAILQ